MKLDTELQQKLNRPRPTRDEAVGAVIDAYIRLKYLIDILEDIFNRENYYRMRKIYQPRKRDTKK